MFFRFWFFRFVELVILILRVCEIIAELIRSRLYP